LHVLVRILDTVKRGLRGSFQGFLSQREIWRRGWDLYPAPHVELYTYSAADGIFRG
jgi:hypothetical protein